MVSGIAFMVLLAAAIVGPIGILIVGRRAMFGALAFLFLSGTLAMPLAATSQPADFRGSAVIIAAVAFVFGLVAINIAGVLRAPRRVR